MRLSFFVSAVIYFATLASSVKTSNDYSQNERGLCFPPPGIPTNVSFPLFDDLFPDTEPGSPEDEDIAKRAHGMPPNGQTTTTLSPNAINAIRLVAFVGIYFVAFYTQILVFIVEKKPGYYIRDSNEYDYIVQALTAIKAQEEQHVLACNNLLKKIGAQPVQPCRYKLPNPTRDLTSAFYVENLLTELFLGVGQDIVRIISGSGNTELLAPVVSVVENRAEQVGWFRSVNNKIPSSNPFVTGASLEYGYSSLMQYAVVPGSCPKGGTIDLPVFGELVLAQTPPPCSGVDQTLVFSIKGSDLAIISDLYVVYINQQNLPIAVTIFDSYVGGGCINFKAIFPCTLKTFGEGLTIAVLAIGPGPFQSVAELTKVTKFGPYLIEYN